MIPVDDKTPLYVPLAKLVLWAVSVTLLIAIVGGVYAAYCLAAGRQYKPEVVDNVVQASQVLSIITLSVLGYRGRHR